MPKIVRGTDGYDLIDGGAANETFLAYSGNDLIREMPFPSSSDAFHGMQGNDKLISYGGDDLLFGGKGNDEMLIVTRIGEVKAIGGEGHDELVIYGLAEADAHIDDSGNMTVITDDDGFRLAIRGIEDFEFAA